MSESVYNLLSLLRWTILAASIALAGNAIGDGLATQGERAVQRIFICQMEFQKNQLERLLPERGERG